MHLLRLLTAAIWICFSVTATAQTNPSQKTGKISGRIVDEQKKPVGYATVTLLKSDSTVVNGTLTGDDGAFTIEPTGTGNFLLRISGIGFTTRTIDNISITPDAPEKKTGNITVKAVARMMKEVEVTAERSMVEMSVDKKVFNVEKNITTAGGSASDVLQNIPSITVDADGGVSLRGKSNVTILIDGKPATLLGGDDASALQSLPAASIQSVEVITNPSAKYDAQGMGGIINIVTKKDRKLGLNGTITAGAGTGDKYNAGINLNMKNEKWNVFFNSNARSNHNRHYNATDRYNENGIHYDTDERFTRLFVGWFNSLGAEYTIDDRNTITLTENINIMRWGSDGTTLFRTFAPDGQLLSTQKRVGDRLGGPFSTSTSLDYKHKFAKPKQELSSNITFAKTWIFHNQNLATYDYDSNEVQQSNPIFRKAPGEGSTSSLNGQADFTTGFLTKNGKLDAGWKSQLYWFETSNEPTIDSGSGAYTDNLLRNKYQYDQGIHAAYASFSDQYKNWTYQAGLRLEYMNYDGTATFFYDNRLVDTSFVVEYLGLFPSAFVSYKLTKDQAIYLNYTRRTDRPHFMQLMPIIDISNPQDTGRGNPTLLPEFIHNVELNYNRQFTKGHHIIAGAYYQYTKNLIERLRTFYDSTGTTSNMPMNLGSGITYGLELIGKAQIMPVWDATLSFNYFRNEIHGQNIDPTLNNSGNSWFSKLNTSVRLPMGFSLQVNGNYEAPKVATQGVLQEVWWLDAAIRKNLMNNKATLVVNVSDIFNTRKYTTRYDLDGDYQTFYRDRETRVGNITFTYRFGKTDMRSANGRRRSQNAPVPEKDRNNIRTDDSDQGGY